MWFYNAFWEFIAWIILSVDDWFENWLFAKPKWLQALIAFTIVTLCIIGVGLVDGSIPPEHFRYY